jgi:hypothetical protein
MRITGTYLIQLMSRCQVRGGDAANCRSDTDQPSMDDDNGTVCDPTTLVDTSSNATVMLKE